MKDIFNKVSSKISDIGLLDIQPGIHIFLTPDTGEPDI